MSRWKTKSLTPPFREVIEILRDNGSGQNEFNEPVESWPVLTTIRGAMERIDATEQARQGVVNIIQRWRVTIRETDVTEVDKLRLKGTSRILNIQSVTSRDDFPPIMELIVVERK